MSSINRNAFKKHRFDNKVRSEFKRAAITTTKTFADMYREVAASLRKRGALAIPSIDTVRQWATDEQWSIKSEIMKESVRKSIREKLAEYAEQIGFRVEKAVLDSLIEMIEARRKNGEPDFLTKDKAITHLAKIFELYGAEKYELKGEPVTEIVVRFDNEPQRECLDGEEESNGVHAADQQEACVPAE